MNKTRIVKDDVSNSYFTEDCVNAYSVRLSSKYIEGKDETFFLFFLKFN